MTQEITPELQARMVALVRQMHEKGRDRIEFSMPARDWTSEAYAEARAIVAELPAPVDPDLLIAREVACNNSRWTLGDAQWMAVIEGRQDHIPMVKCALAAIKRIRQEGAKG